MTAPTPDQLRDALQHAAADAPTLDELRPRLRPGARPHRSGLLVAAAAAAVVGVVVGAGLLVGRDGGGPVGSSPGTIPATAVPSEYTGGSCFGEADLDTDLRTDFAFSTGAPDGLAHTVAQALSSARDLCASYGVGGTFVTDPAQLPGSPIPTAAPSLELALCVLEDGRIGVFPGDADTCGVLGLPVAVAAP